jgi:hypothetical protein
VKRHWISGGVAATTIVFCVAFVAERRSTFAADVENSDDAIPAPKIIGEGIISTDGDELSGGVTPGGKTLIFEKSAAPHYLYIMCESHLMDGRWSRPVNLGPKINGRARDYSPRISADGLWLYFTSEKGFLDEAREQPYTYQLLTDGLKTVGNGMGNLYKVPLEPVLSAARAQLRAIGVK